MIRRSLAAAASLAVVTAGLVGMSPLATGATPIDVSSCFAERLVVAPAGNVAYVGCSEGGVAIANLNTGSVRNARGLAQGDMPSDVAASGSFGYAALTIAHEIRRIETDGTTAKVRSLAEGDVPMTIDLTPDATVAAAGIDGSAGNYLAIFSTDVQDKASTTVALLGRPVVATAFEIGDAHLASVVVDTGFGGPYKVQTIDLDKNSVRGSALSLSAARGTPVGIESSADGRSIYLLQSGGHVSVLNPGAATAARTILLGAGDWKSLSISPDGNWLYALGTPLSTGEARISVINVATSEVTALPDAIADYSLGIAATTAGRILLYGFDSIDTLFTNVPVVDEVLPAWLPSSGDERIIVHGKNLDGATVRVAGNPCPILRSSATSLTCVSPPFDSLDPATVVLSNAAGPATVATIPVRLQAFSAPTAVDAFTSTDSALLYFTGSNLATRFLAGYQVAVQRSDSTGQASGWTTVTTTSGTATALRLTRADLGVSVNDLVRFRVTTVAKTGAKSVASELSPWRQMTNAVAAPTNVSATYDAKSDWMVMRWDAPRADALGGRNLHGYEFQYLWPGYKTWTSFGQPIKDSDTTSIWDLGNVPRGTLKVRIRAISWPEKYYSDWTADVAIRK